MKTTTDNRKSFLQTSVAATSTIYQLSQNPDKQEILYKELKSIMPDVRSPVDTKILEQMPFLRACIKETLRYYHSFTLLSHKIYCISFRDEFSKISHSFADCIPLLLVMVEIYNRMRLSMVFRFQKGYVHCILTFACFISYDSFLVFIFWTDARHFSTFSRFQFG